MRRDLYELVDLAIAQGIRTSITTNGLLIDEHHVRELARRDVLWLSVSLDGATRETNDAIRGAGVFDGVLNRVALLRGRVPFSLAMTVTSTNAHEARAFGALARSVGASGAVLRPLYPTGLAATRLDLVPSFAQYRAAVAALNDGAELDGCGFASAEPFGPEERDRSSANVVTNLGCGAGDDPRRDLFERRGEPVLFSRVGVRRSFGARDTVREDMGRRAPVCAISQRGRTRSLRRRLPRPRPRPQRRRVRSRPVARRARRSRARSTRDASRSEEPVTVDLRSIHRWIWDEIVAFPAPETALEAASALVANGSIDTAASLLDRAWGHHPSHRALQDARANVLDSLAVKEHSITFRYVPAGWFWQGSEDGDHDERPRRRVELDPVLDRRRPAHVDADRDVRRPRASARASMEERRSHRRR
jgi:hypothetical protein